MTLADALSDFRFVPELATCFACMKICGILYVACFNVHKKHRNRLKLIFMILWVAAFAVAVTGLLGLSKKYSYG